MSISFLRGYFEDEVFLGLVVQVKDEFGTALVSSVEGVNRIKTSIGVCAHNEASNIGKLLERLLEQETNVADIIQIVVVSCSTDETNKIVRRYMQRDGRVELVVQKKRDGKASAVNLFLKMAKGEVLVLESADTLPEKWTIEKLVEPFLDPCVGMTGGRPIPTNDSGEIMGYVSHLLWRMHHEVSLANPENPKCGELIAFRNIIESIPKDTVVDEAWIERADRSKGFSLRYAAGAVVYNHGPETVSDFLKQRRRIHSGHLCLKKQSGYMVSTMNASKLLKVFPRVFEPNLLRFPFFVGAIFLEGYGRLLGTYDFYIRKRNPYVWDMVESTKEV
jgi:cellulose synthase/poly-beta-1,6-N-acetylglucosamine synthase-like glycosyltransferase